MEKSETVKCSYCGGLCCLKHKDMHHPVWKEMVHIDMYECTICKSLTTYPMPSIEHLSFCYDKYSFNGFPDHKLKAKESSSQHLWYSEILKLFDFHPPGHVRIADVGAGEGLLEEALLKFSSYDLNCFDYHQMPTRIKALNEAGAKIGWHSVDLSTQDWMPRQNYDYVFCISVIEHVIDPVKLVNDLLSMAVNGGKIYLIGPCIDTLYYKLLRQKWVYIIPGEHLSIPSIKGLELLTKGITQQKHRARIIKVSYSLKYVLDGFFRINVPSFLDVVFKFPVGAFALEISK
jgi:hypothetical protein